ncbi:hypothetical protein RND81_06G249500 [Saponaria officinalis]|uniref:F-box associated beta-propeller type 1 domain-containing protein n=1 Tax=Saponaria officinalis TaxID=3572 RepID=A0AAW1KB26_SAPOF
MKLVCKSFNTLISSPQFVNEHLQRSVSTNTGQLVILNTTGRGLHAFNFDALESPPFYIPFPGTFSNITCIFGSCNGLVYYYRLMVLNPFTGMSFEIPSYFHSSEMVVSLYMPIACHHIGFGFDDLSNDYKIVLIIATRERWDVIVYSFRAKSWKTIASPTLSKGSTELKYNDNAALIDNHLLHWIFTEYENVNRAPLSYSERNRCSMIGKIGRIGCFDLRTEQWVDDVGLPKEYDESLGCYSTCETLGVFDGRLCLLTPTRSEPLLTRVDMWVIKEYGVRDSWVKVLGVSDLGVTSTLRRCPLGLDYGSIFDSSSEHEILVFRGNKHPFSRSERLVLIWYNMKQKKIRVSELHDVHVEQQQFYDVCTCTKSLITLPGGTRITTKRRSLREKQLIKLIKRMIYV